MIIVSVKNEIESALRQLGNFERRQLPFVIAKALTATAQDAKAALRTAMPAAYDRPTPWTLNSLYVSPATKANLEARVFLKDQASGGTPAAKYLGPSIFGGQRRTKGVERLLTGMGVLPQGMAVVPASGAEIDSYGNMKRGQYTKIIKQIKTDGLTGPSIAAKKRKSKVRATYFVAVPGVSKLHPGVWERAGSSKGGGVRPVMLFIKVPAYKKQFDFFGLTEKTIRDRFSVNLSEAMAYALATSR